MRSVDNIIQKSNAIAGISLVNFSQFLATLGVGGSSAELNKHKFVQKVAKEKILLILILKEN